MSESRIPERFNDLLSWEKRVLAHLAVVRRDGTPHVTPMWFDYNGTHLIFNTARGRVKTQSLGPDAMVAFSIVDPQNNGRAIQIVGRVVHETEQGGYEQICRLCEKYGRPAYPRIPGQVRVTYKVLPVRVSFVEYVFEDGDAGRWPADYAGGPALGRVASQ
jgi:PPOX class probable F420-dependent enzyme